MGRPLAQHPCGRKFRYSELFLSISGLRRGFSCARSSSVAPAAAKCATPPALPGGTSFPPPSGERSMATQAQIIANRENARKSTGPRTEGGKIISARNGIVHGLCSSEDRTEAAL